jgi:catechol 2,3-dioxygenase-like lactoylglutathione lyase family enzyme
VPIDHIKLPVADLDSSRAFSAALAPLGWKLVWDEAPTLGFGRGDGGEDDEPFALERGDPPNVRSHVAFTAADTTQVDAFHRGCVPRRRGEALAFSAMARVRILYCPV